MRYLIPRLWWIFLLIAILARIYLTPVPTSPDALLSSTLPKDAERSVLLLTAHPDDEAMFFAPTILHLVRHGWDVRGLCLSTGNATGLGDIRRRELMESYRVLGVKRDKVSYLDEPELQDGMDIEWDPEHDILPHLTAHLQEHPVSTILTFDPSGITRHPNHAVLPYAAILVNPPVQVAVLHSPSIFTKFTGPLWAMYLRLKGLERDDMAVVTSEPGEWYRGIEAMLEHRSQLVWFRWLYLGFSRLMWTNELILL